MKKVLRRDEHITLRDSHLTFRVIFLLGWFRPGERQGQNMAAGNREYGVK